MVLVDTSAWIEWLIGSATAERLADQMPAQSDWLVPTMVQLELARSLTRELGEDRADYVIAFTQVCVLSRSTPKSPLRQPRQGARTGSPRRTPSSTQPPVAMAQRC